MIEANPEEAFGTGFPATSQVTRARERLEAANKLFSDTKARLEKDLNEALDVLEEASSDAKRHHIALGERAAVVRSEEFLRKHGRLND